MRTVTRPLSLLVLMTLLLPCLHARAQVVRKCRIDGRLVYQSSPCPIAATPSTAQEPVAASATGASGPAAKKSLAEVLRERDALDRIPSIASESQGDGANLLRPRMGAL